MKISYNWLKEWVDLSISTQELADKLTMAGLEIEDALPLDDDVILDLSITPNRGDCLGMLGIAREVAQLTGSSLKLSKFELKEAASETKKCVKVKLDDSKACPRYTARVIKNVSIGPSPGWLVKRLAALGIRSVNNVVDVTNYVLLERGHPLHAFDLDRISDSTIIVRSAANKEKFTTLDGIERTLSQDMLLIADTQKAVALAGVMGGANTEVTPYTRNVLLECAYFNPSIIRRTSRRLGLSTDSSYRFERGVDPLGLPRAIDRAAWLIKELAGGDIMRGMIDEYPQPIKPATVNLRPARVNRILGTNLDPRQITGIIERLGLTIRKRQNEELKLEIPSYRSDITREIDVIEEIARIYGYQNIPQTAPKSCVANNPVNELYELENKARNILVGCGFWEAINFSFTNEKICYKLHMKNRGLKLKNPLNQEQQLLRTSLIPSLLENVSTNIKRQQVDVCIFELSTVYEKAVAGESAVEKRLISGAMTGKRQTPFWGERPAEIDYYDVKGTVEALLTGFGIEGARFSPIELSFLQPGVQVAEERVGVLGRLAEGIGLKLDLEQAVYVFELDFMSMLEHVPGKKAFEPLCRYPAVMRDIALVISEDITAREVEDVIRDSRQPHLRWVKLFDVYRGAPLDKGYKSLAFSLSYQSDEKTLTEEEINSDWAQLVDELGQKLGATLRK